MASLFENLRLMISGVGITLILTVLSSLLGFLLALLFTWLLLTQKGILKYMVQIYLFIIRGTPLLVQLYFLYYGLGQFEWVRKSIFWYGLKEPFFCATITLIFNTTAYTTVLLAGAIKHLPAGESLACQALGMSRIQTLRRILLPSALRGIFPEYSNEVIMILKSTALASTITLLDLMGVTQQIIAETYQNLFYLMWAGIFYLVLNFLIIRIFRWLESNYGLINH